MSGTNKRIKAGEVIVSCCSDLLHCELSEKEIMKRLMLIFSILENLANFDANTVAEDVTFELFRFSQFHDKAQRKWREQMLEDFTDVDELLVRLETEEQAKPKTEPNILDLSSQVTKEDDCIDLAKHISAVLNDPRTPETIKANLKDGLSELYQPSQCMTTPEYIAEMLCDQENQEVKEND